MSGNGPILVYYDGLCPVCSREVALYRQLNRCGGIRWQDLAEDTDPSLDLDAAFRLLHVRDTGGFLHIGFDAHLLMWERLRGFRLLAWALRRCRPGRLVAESVYLWLTARRPGLRRRQAASSGINA
ncbi:thiol-disulfide oxidoreductase DCC family protein [Dokdonella sp.]|uniref:thiol-disulfide oxidoreductase DCC family protein n=1 Tax=Dokdonella sp. TaxID=2291710 RepID=UPI003528DB4B